MNIYMRFIFIFTDELILLSKDVMNSRIHPLKA